MKTMKKIMAVLLAAIMTLAMAVTAFAAEGTEGTITVKVKDGQNLAGQTVNFYKLFDLSVNNGHYAYKVNTKYQSILDEILGKSYTSDQEYYEAVSTKVGNTNDAEEVQNFANDFTKKILAFNATETDADKKITAEDTQTFTANDTTKTSFESKELPYGYYLICQTGTKAIQSSLVTLQGTTAEVNLKSEAPSIEKTANVETVNVGQTVTYTIKGTVPDMTGYTNYVYKIHDTLTDGLDFVKSDDGKVAVTVKIGGQAVSDVTTAEFVDANGVTSETATRTMLLDLSKKVQAATTGDEIEVTYQATVNKDAVVTTNNKATLEYSNNPGEDSTGTSKPSEVVTPTYPLDVNKTDTNNVMLADAHFTLYASNDDGSINKSAPIKVTKDSDGKYTYAADQNTETNTDMVSVDSQLDGKGYNLHLNGLAAGTYYLEETQAPDGYNKLADPVKIIITKSTTTDETAWTMTKNGADETDKIIDIENSTGSLLPSTGGKGAIAFAVVAAVLVFGVAVSFVRDRRRA